MIDLVEFLHKNRGHFLGDIPDDAFQFPFGGQHVVPLGSQLIHGQQTGSHGGQTGVQSQNDEGGQDQAPGQILLGILDFTGHIAGGAHAVKGPGSSGDTGQQGHDAAGTGETGQRCAGQEVVALDEEHADALKKAIAEVKALMLELEQAEAVEAAAQRAADRELDRRQRVAGRPFSLVRYIAGIVAGNLEGIEKEVDEMGAKEYERLGLTRRGHVIPSAYLRAASGQNYTTAADGGNLTEEGERRYFDILKDKLVVAGLGATVLTDLVGTFTAISSSAVQAAWEGVAQHPTTPLGCLPSCSSRRGS